jgi:hypothetical protein
MDWSRGTFRLRRGGVLEWPRLVRLAWWSGASDYCPDHRLRFETPLVGEEATETGIS